MMPPYASFFYTPYTHMNQYPDYAVEARLNQLESDIKHMNLQFDAIDRRFTISDRRFGFLALGICISTMIVLLGTMAMGFLWLGEKL